MGLKGAALGGSGRKSGSDEAGGPDLTAGPSVQGAGGGILWGVSSGQPVLMQAMNMLRLFRGEAKALIKIADLNVVF